MRFLVSMAEAGHFAHWGELSEAEQGSVFEAFGVFDAAVRERGAMLAGEGLQPPEQARTLRPGTAAERIVVEGPYAETAEQVGGFFLVDLPSMDDAVELARLLPAAYTIEVRPVDEQVDEQVEG